MEKFGLSPVEFIGVCVVLFLFIVQLFYYMYFYAALPFYKTPPSSSNSLPPVSVIICAKNELENLKVNLPVILNQDYPNFQVVVINDCSSDETEDYLAEIQKKYPNLYSSNIKEDPVFKHGKKLAVTMGIKAAKYDHLLFTDADCKPISDKWISAMAQHFTDQITMVLGTYSLKTEKGLLNQLQQYENLNSKILYLGYAIRKRPYMGVGGNLAYHKKMFFDNKGFAGHYHIPSGDDDLFVNSVAKANNTTVEFSAESKVVTEGKTSWHKYFTQKQRHMGASVYYKSKHKRWLFFDTLSMGLFFVFATIAAIFKIMPILMGAFLLARVLIAGVIINVAAKKLGHGRMVFSYIYLDLLLPAMYLVLMLKNRFRPKSIRWK